jgi:hypothetical protein
MKRCLPLLTLWLLLLAATPGWGGVGDPQIRTDHPWYPGELACSTFERLFATQAELYKRVVGVKPVTDQDRALASWLWRNTHYAHAEDGPEDLWGRGFNKGGDTRAREYWTGLFAQGFGLCGTTHSQWVAEMENLLGHSRGRAVGVSGHNSFEVFLTGGPYGKGKWVLLDHDISTVIFNKDGTALLSLAEIQKNWQQLTQRTHAASRQHGWLVCGLHPDDGGVYSTYQVAEYLAGYSGPPPIVHLRRGETMRRYFQPGLEDGKTFVFWGRNYNTGGIPGLERSHTWVNQPEKMYQSKSGTGYIPGQARFANVVYTYRPNFANGDYKESIIDEKDGTVTFEFYTPYIIAATPPNQKPWGIFDAGCKNGLVLHGKARCQVALSADQGKNWKECGQFVDGMDLTDLVKGHRQYFLRLHATADELKSSELKITTVCQANAAVLPRLKDNDTKVTFQADGRGIVSAGPNLPQAQRHVVEGKFGSPRVALKLATPRGESAVAIYAAAHVASGSPPRTDVKYQIEFSVDGGKTWKSMVKDWTIPRRGHEPGDFWSQSLCWGSVDLQEKLAASQVLARFRNDGGRPYSRCEVHLIYRLPKQDATRVTYAWTDQRGARQATHFFPGGGAARGQEASWSIPTGETVQTRWVEFAPEVQKE